MPGLDTMSMTRRIALVLTAALATAALACPAAASCSVDPTSVVFGNYDPLSPSALHGVGAINVQCDPETSFAVSFSSGNGTVANRRMTGGGGQLAYNLYKDSARLMVWGEGMDGASATGTMVDMTIYGRIPAGQNVPANVYLDSISVTMTF